MLTVIMATRNGAATLPAVLEHYARLRAPRQSWRLLVVDNASDDATPAVLERYRVRLPMQILQQPQRGKNAALNLALDELFAKSAPRVVRDELLIFTDDDALPAPDWLQQWERCALDQPGYSIFGGAISADWAASPPPWLTRLIPLGLTFGITARDLKAGPLHPGLVWGANMAVRARVFASGVRFDSSVGPAGQCYAMGSEIELTRRLGRAGHGAWFHPGARVSHHIRRSQLTLEYVLQKAWRAGRGQFRQDQPGLFPEWRAVPRWMYLMALKETLGWLAAALLRRSDQAIRHRWELAFLSGYFYEARAGHAPVTRVVLTSFSGELGGMELRMAQEARYLRQLGHDALLALRNFEGLETWRTQLGKEQLAVTAFDAPPFLEQWHWRRWNLLRARGSAARRLRAFRARLVHIAWCWTHYGASVTWLAQHCKIPAVISVHNAFAYTPLTPWQHGLLTQAFANVRGVYAVSESAMQHFLAIYQKVLAPQTKLAVIPNCVDTQRFRPDSERRVAARERWQLRADGLVIGCAARLSVQKQPLQLLALYCRLRLQFPDLQLVYAGSGPLEAQLRARVTELGLTDQVIFTGFLTDVETLLPAFDLHLLMSRNEGFGIATIEAMACGVAVAASDVPGSADILRNSHAGILLPADDLAATATLVTDLLMDSARRAAMGREGRVEALQRYSNEVVGAQVHAFYRELL